MPAITPKKQGNESSSMRFQSVDELFASLSVHDIRHALKQSWLDVQDLQKKLQEVVQDRKTDILQSSDEAVSIHGTVEKLRDELGLLVAEGLDLKVPQQNETSQGHTVISQEQAANEQSSTHATYQNLLAQYNGLVSDLIGDGCFLEASVLIQIIQQREVTCTDIDGSSTYALQYALVRACKRYLIPARHMIRHFGKLMPQLECSIALSWLFGDTPEDAAARYICFRFQLLQKLQTEVEALTSPTWDQCIRLLQDLLLVTRSTVQTHAGLFERSQDSNKEPLVRTIKCFIRTLSNNAPSEEPLSTIPNSFNKTVTFPEFLLKARSNLAGLLDVMLEQCTTITQIQALARDFHKLLQDESLEIEEKKSSRYVPELNRNLEASLRNMIDSIVYERRDWKEEFVNCMQVNTNNYMHEILTPLLDPIRRKFEKLLVDAGMEAVQRFESTYSQELTVVTEMMQNISKECDARPIDVTEDCNLVESPLQMLDNWLQNREAIVSSENWTGQLRNTRNSCAARSVQQHNRLDDAACPSTFSTANIATAWNSLHDALRSIASTFPDFTGQFQDDQVSNEALSRVFCKIDESYAHKLRNLEQRVVSIQKEIVSMSRAILQVQHPRTMADNISPLKFATNTFQSIGLCVWLSQLSLQELCQVSGAISELPLSHKQVCSLTNQCTATWALSAATIMCVSPTNATREVVSSMKQDHQRTTELIKLWGWIGVRVGGAEDDYASVADTMADDGSSSLAPTETGTEFGTVAADFEYVWAPARASKEISEMLMMLSRALKDIHSNPFKQFCSGNGNFEEVNERNLLRLNDARTDCELHVISSARSIPSKNLDKDAYRQICTPHSMPGYIVPTYILQSVSDATQSNLYKLEIDNWGRVERVSPINTAEQKSQIVKKHLISTFQNASQIFLLAAAHGLGQLTLDHRIRVFESNDEESSAQSGGRSSIIDSLMLQTLFDLSTLNYICVPQVGSRKSGQLDKDQLTVALFPAFDNPECNNRTTPKENVSISERHDCAAKILSHVWQHAKESNDSSMNEEPESINIWQRNFEEFSERIASLVDPIDYTLTEPLILQLSPTHAYTMRALFGDSFLFQLESSKTFDKYLRRATKTLQRAIPYSGPQTLDMLDEDSKLQSNSMVYADTVFALQSSCLNDEEIATETEYFTDEELHAAAKRLKESELSRAWNEQVSLVPNDPSAFKSSLVKARPSKNTENFTDQLFISPQKALQQTLDREHGHIVFSSKTFNENNDHTAMNLQNGVSGDVTQRQANEFARQARAMGSSFRTHAQGFMNQMSAYLNTSERL